MKTDELLSMLYTADCMAKGGRTKAGSLPVSVLAGDLELPIAEPAVTIEGGGASPRYIAVHIDPAELVRRIEQLRKDAEIMRELLVRLKEQVKL